LAYSRALWAELVFELTAASLCRSLVRGTTWMQGAARQWLFDNAKAVVLERHGDAARFHPDLLDLASHYHVQPRLCAVGQAPQKGRVERAVRYLRERFFAGRRITDLASGNRELARFLEEIALPRSHPVFKDRSVAEVLAEERPQLLPLPATPPATDRVLSVAADKTASVRFDTNLYSVPPAAPTTPGPSPTPASSTAPRAHYRSRSTSPCRATSPTATSAPTTSRTTMTHPNADVPQALKSLGLRASPDALTAFFTHATKS